ELVAVQGRNFVRQIRRQILERLLPGDPVRQNGRLFAGTRGVWKPHQPLIDALALLFAQRQNRSIDACYASRGFIQAVVSRLAAETPTALNGRDQNETSNYPGRGDGIASRRPRRLCF